MTRALPLVLLCGSTLPIPGCSSPEERFLDDYGAIVCRRAEECDSTYNFDSQRACRDWFEDFVDAVFDDLECDFDRARSRSCLRALRGVSCAEFLEFELEECDGDRIWSC